MEGEFFFIQALENLDLSYMNIKLVFNSCNRRMIESGYGYLWSKLDQKQMQACQLKMK